MLKINSLQSFTLDFIRVFASQLVVIGHLLSFFHIGNEEMPYIQNTGVVMFFILSGLIISYTIFYKSQFGYSFKTFFIERFSRIYTGLIPSLLFILLVDSISRYLDYSLYSFTDAFNIKTFLGNLLMLQDYNYIGYYLNNIIPLDFKITSFGSARSLWTLAIEWWLYMFFGILYFYYRKNFSWRYLPLLLVLSIIPLWNLVGGRGNGLTIYWIFGLFITLYVFRKQEISKTLSLLSFILFILFAFIYMLFVEREAYNLHYAFFLSGAIFFLMLYQKDVHKQYNKKITKYVKCMASYSYTLYLIHYTIITFIISLNLPYDNILLAVMSFLVSNILALLLASVGEMKYRQVSDKIKIYGMNNVK